MDQAPEAVLDASALIALLWDEAGGSAVEALLGKAVISAVNWAEVLQRYQAHGAASDGKRADLEALGVDVADFTAQDADLVARLRPSTRAIGLSLADRACLALAMRLGIAAHTADRVWADVDVGAEVVVIR